ncbi:CusA/CzcA family heavy metal efflux RND transporter [Adhaeribacter sp. BT258]|uniref:CusA/CzcA family heavy metal efflux RND transporter n=1 Tax=Adhaeribacter terrigena TaxID=2793070 RepID=A0ABS1C4N4_9BACT|nr:CusA/CzcA family heavy metal efflux RND transporter [Adhaeribacter terrigena]MBK0404365.1 CusA/CzcA family heavy metal efflux RND transporter [Adhaeribacter terrigena]
MIDKIIDFSIRNKLIVGLLIAALIGCGGYSVTQLPIDAVPDITNNQVQVITVSPSLAAQEVERLITFPVEVTMATVPGITEIRSFSRFGLSIVTIVFTDETDIYWARSQINERLKQAEAQIPPGIGAPELAPVTTGLGEIYQYILRPKKGFESKYNPTELRSIQDWIVRRQLLGTKGVADVSSFGGYLKQYEVALNPGRLRALGLSISDVYNALEQNNQNTGGAYIEKKPNAYFIRTEGLAQNLDDVGKMVVKNTPNGTPVLIRDVGEVRFGHAVRYGAMTYNNEGEVVGAIVMMLKGANSSKVIQEVKMRIAEIEKTLPEGLIIEPYLDRTKLVDNAIQTVIKNLTEGALIVVFVLVLMLGNLRAGLVVASVIPLSMLFAISMMNVFGVSGNLMSLGAIDFGLIVDGAVIIVESVIHGIVIKKQYHTGVKKLTQAQMDGEVAESAKKMMHFAAFGQMIILIVYLPILSLTGIEGKMFKPMAQTVAFAIIGAFLLSLTYVPMASALFLSKHTEHKRNISDRLIEKLQTWYHPIIKKALRFKFLVLGMAAGLFAVALLLFLRMGGEFIPTLDEGDFAVETRLVNGSSLSQTVETAQKAAAILLKNFPEVKEVVGKIGSSEIPVDPMPVESCDLIVVLKDKSEWTSATGREELAAKMSKALEELPGVSFGFQQPIQMRFNELMTGARQDVVIKIYGDDLDELSNLANKIGQEVSKVSGATDLYVEQVTGLPQIVVKLNRDQLARYGLTVETVNTTVESAFAGKIAGLVFEGEKRFDLVLRLEEASRQRIEDVQNLTVTLPDGNQIPLTAVAEVSFKEGPIQIQRDDTKRRITVGFNVRNRDVQSLVQEIEQRINQKIQMPVGYYITYGGQFQNLVEASSRLAVAVPLALALIFVLLFFAFKSFKHSLLIFTAIPLSAIGGVLALYLRGMPFSISAGVGFIALFGVAVLNGIVLVGYFNQLKAAGMKDLHRIVLTGTSVRLRPVLMTALVASLGFMPMALSGSSGAEVQKPLATVVIGGLISATALTLIVLPILYILFERMHFGKKKPVALSFLLLFASVFATQSQAQIEIQSQKTLGKKPLKLEELIELAKKQNAGLRASEMEIQAQRSLKKASSDLGKTRFDLEYGQVNTPLNDTRFDVSQSIPFPTMLARQAGLARAEIKQSELRQARTQQELVYDVKNAYYQLVYFQQVGQLLLRQDSLYALSARAAEIRFKTGETYLLEKASAETQLMHIRAQIPQNEADISAWQARLQALLNTSEPIEIELPALPKRPLTFVPDTSVLRQTPAWSLAMQQIEVQQKLYSLEKAKALPDLTVGYFNQSFRGPMTVNGVEQTFTGSDRFDGITAGIALPLWWRQYAARVQAAKFHRKQAENLAVQQQHTLRGELTQALQAFEKEKTALNYYEQSALKQSELVLRLSEKSFRSGEIGYVEYLQSARMALEIQTTYLERLLRYNLTITELEFICGQL